MQTARLSAKVRAQNKVNQIAAQHAPAFLAALAPFVGQKIYKADGEFTAKVKAALPKGTDGYFNSSNYSLSRVFRLSEPVIGQSGSEYMQATVYFGKVDNGILVELWPFKAEDFRTDYNVEEIVQAREELRAAQAAVSRAQGKLQVFGEFDR